MTARLIPVLAAAIASFAASVALAAWPADPGLGVPLSLATGEKYDVFAVSDGCGGAIVAWEDRRSGDYDIHAQRVDVAGRVLWQVDGVPVCAAPGNQGLYHSSTGTTGFTPLVPDGDGGVWIVWQDERAFASRQRDIYVQRLDADGRPRFGADGIAVAARAGMEDQPSACADGAGGIFVVWQDKTDDPVFYDLHGQRVGPDGALLWNAGQPRPLVVVDWDQDGPTLAPDGAGGFFLAWSDSRVDVGDVYAQRFDEAGNPRWQAGGRPVATGDDGQDAIVLVAGDDGHPLLAWVDRRSGSPDIYAQKLAATDGTPQWTVGGRAVCTAAESQYRPALCADGAGGAYVAWFDYRNASGPPWNLDIYAQRLLASGALAWAANGVQACGAPGPQRDVSIAPALDGVYLAWEDDRATTGLEDIYAQRVTPAGLPAWTAGGVPVCTAARNQNRPQPLAGAGGLLVAWPDDRDVLYANDVYAGRVLDVATAIGVDHVVVDFGAPAAAVVDTVMVFNVGAGPVTVTAVDVVATGGPFAAVSAAPLPLTLAADGSLPILVTFTPAPDATATLVITHDAAQPADPLTVELRGDAALTAMADETPSTGVIALTAFPNPFNPAVTVTLTAPRPGPVTLRVFDSRGRAVRTLVAGDASAVRWDGRDDEGRGLPGGVYVLRLEAAGETATGRVVLAR